jgi:hypothetical protein
VKPIVGHPKGVPKPASRKLAGLLTRSRLLDPTFGLPVAGFVVRDSGVKDRFSRELLGFRMLGTADSKSRIRIGKKFRFPMAATGSNTCSTFHPRQSTRNSVCRISSRPSSKAAIDLIHARGLKNTETASGQSISTIRTPPASNSWNSHRRKHRAATHTQHRTRSRERSLISGNRLMRRVGPNPCQRERDRNTGGRNCGRCRVVDRVQPGDLLAQCPTEIEFDHSARHSISASRCNAARPLVLCLGTGRVFLSSNAF